MDNIKIKRKICDILLFLCVLGIIVLGGKIFLNQWNYKKAEKEYTLLKKSVQKDQEIDWDKLKKINRNIVAWIKIPGTTIDYPIVQGKNNDEYLHKTFHGKYNQSGCIFLDSKCKKDFSSDNNIVYGHHMRNGSMFATLVKYKEHSFWKRHQKIILFTPDETKILRVVGANADKPKNLPVEFKNKEEQEKYSSMIQKYSYLSGMKINNKIYTLVTCSYERNDYRTYVYAIEK